MVRIKWMVFFVMLLVAMPVSADEGPAHKLFRGSVNLLTAPIEIPREARAYWIEGAKKTDHILVWIFCGTVKGVVEGVKRFSSGAWDVLSFPLDSPKRYQSLKQPEYVWQNWPVNPQTGR